MRSYTWGLDVTGSRSAAGGVGALVQIHDHGSGKTLLPAYDGNGNIVTLADAATGNFEAIYEYSPFGELIRAEGDYAKENPFRFSTKFHDQETGLAYYGLRFYSSTLGRFINRDPIGEAGGLNLYGFVGNNGVSRYDMLGMYSVNEIYEDAPDAGVFSRRNPGYEQLNDNTWYDPERDHRMVFMGNQVTGRGGHQDNAYQDEDMGINASFGFAIWAADEAASASFYASLDTTLAQMAAHGNAVFDAIDARIAARQTEAEEKKEEAPNSEAQTQSNLSTGSAVVSGGGSKIGNVLRRIPIVGWALGSVGDIASGRISYGVGSFANVVGRDIASGIIGTAGKVYVAGRDVLGMGGALLSGNFKEFAGKLGATIQHLVIPNYGWYGGAGWGTEQFGSDGSPSPLNVIDQASLAHDDALTNGSGRAGNMHWKWIRDTWSGVGVAPGPIGQAYRLVGSAAFGAGGLLDGRRVGAP